MGKSESKYFATAAKMDEAFLTLLGKKDFDYITVKEICEAAGVNRSTFYLHYETMGDLLSESMEHMIRHFQVYMAQDAGAFIRKIQTCPMEELYLVTPDYLTPYLNYVQAHKRLFRTAVDNAQVLGLSDAYQQMYRYIFMPILERYRVPEQDRPYRMAFYIHGLMAIVAHWLRQDCADAVDQIASLMCSCVMPHQQGA